ncbi:hypothetical protein KSS87_011129 [Heliosperma pusillum]|nr:hypothetical protein KSS87_011129 [Heliosperma pusillum]
MNFPSQGAAFLEHEKNRTFKRRLKNVGGLNSISVCYVEKEAGLEIFHQLCELTFENLNERPERSETTEAKEKETTKSDSVCKDLKIFINFEIRPHSMSQPHSNSFEDEFASKTSLMIRELIYRVQVTIIWETYHREFVVNGEEIDKPAKKWQIFLKDGPPEGCNKVIHHKEVLKLVVGSDADEVYENFVSDSVFLAILTDEEHDKLIG